MSKGSPIQSEPEETLKILTEDPFQVIDRKGVGQLMRIAVHLGKKVETQLEVWHLWGTWWRSKFHPILP